MARTDAEDSHDELDEEQSDVGNSNEQKSCENKSYEDKLHGELSHEKSPKMPSEKLNEEQPKIFDDCVHGNIEIHPLLVRIIDTPPFQRLRNLKQLGVTYFVYPGASHNRFEHSIGVAYLAGRLVRKLRRKQTELQISDNDVLSIQIAGLCHDIGHGPFSHTFESRFIRATRTDLVQKWRHESMSVKIFEDILTDSEYGLECELKKYNLSADDFIFIKEVIAGPQSCAESCAWPYKGRDQKKAFLYQIVANSINGVDVDKWDYIARDSYHLDVPNGFDYKRLIKFARVEMNTRTRLPEIIYRDKEIDSLCQLHCARHWYHRNAYQHKTAVIIDYMLGEALKKANDYIFVTGADRQKVKMSHAIEDVKAFIKLDDSIYHKILYSRDSCLMEARSILEAIERRHLYPLVGQVKPFRTMRTKKALLEEIHTKMSQHSKQKFTEANIVIQVSAFHCGMERSNPVDTVLFYSKLRPKTAVERCRKEDALISSAINEEFTIRVYCKLTDKSEIEAAQKCFEVVKTELVPYLRITNDRTDI